VERIRFFQPDVVITFGGDGGQNTHPDHMMVSALTTAAFHWARQEKRYPAAGSVHQTKRLFYLSANFHIPDRPPAMTMPWTVTLDTRSVQERRSEAFRQHTTQAPLMEKTKDVFAKYGGEEFYTLVATTEPQAARQMTDLFEGLD
jgi:LmbE family N-acetylglucosaminyl deacetylase